MMKSFVLVLSTLLFANQVYATATLRIPVFIEGNSKPVPAAELNKELAAAGFPAVPLYFEVSTGSDAQLLISALTQDVERALSSLGGKYDGLTLQKSLVPTDNDTAKYATCYSGDANEVADLAQSLTDIYFSEQMTLWGFKFKQTVVYTLSDDEETVEHLNYKSALWRNWTGANEDILILSAVGDGGEDVQESLLKKCR